jgi:hypothetical protein
MPTEVLSVVVAVELHRISAGIYHDTRMPVIVMFRIVDLDDEYPRLR